MRLIWFLIGWCSACVVVAAACVGALWLFNAGSGRPVTQ